MSDARSPILHQRFMLGPVAEESRSVEVVASTEALDSHGTIVKQNWRLDRFMSNPVVLYSHASNGLPIGLASDVRVQDGKLRATINFSTEELNPLAEQVFKNVKAGVLRGISVGFYPHTVRFETEQDREIPVLDDNELFEISVTPVQSNPETLAMMRARAVQTAEPKTILRPSPMARLAAEIRRALGQK